MSLGVEQDTLNNLDSDDDDDYVPPNKQDSDSEASEAEGGNDGIQVIPITTVDEETKKRQREALWSSFQASVANPSKPSDAGPTTKKVVQVERRYRFAGEELVEVVEVLEDSAEAKKWPLWKDPNKSRETKPAPSGRDPSPPASTLASASHSPIPVVAASEGVKMLGTNPPSSSTLSTPEISFGSTKPTPRRPGPRKPKTSLAPLPGTSKAQKLTTLDKSAMDWKKHLLAEQEAGSSIKDDLEANRRAGGYLEKVEFLKRVEERKEENLDAMKGNKRRKL